MAKNGCKFDEAPEERESHLGHDWSSIKTPDSEWLGNRRNPHMILLTGPHPLNAEPPMQKLMEGLQTNSKWHFVRNHGTVPKLDWNTHSISIGGLVNTPRSVSMKELVELPLEWHIDTLVTLTCDGNRRKELNTIKKTRGYNWGAGATSTSRWKGVALHQLIQSYCGGIQTSKTDSPLYICFDGADELSKGSYGTSIPLSWALDPTRDIMLAYEMNGERLEPDHGFPVRILLPGMVGGRCIKWLKSIVVSEEESKSHYHSFDNRLLPPGMTYHQAMSSGQFNNPDTIIYEHCINSVITRPSFGEWLAVENFEQSYVMKGYAYSGGGRKIRRVEVTFDDGKHWDQCKVEYPEGASRHRGTKYWTWCHWTLEVSPWKLLNVKEVAVRALDESFNTQPQSHSWNPLGVMNNAWYRVQVTVRELIEATGGQDTTPSQKPTPWLVFRHPVRQGNIYGGWMLPPLEMIEEYRQLRVPPTSADIALGQGEFAREFTMEEVNKHNKREDCWVVIDGAVYDLTSYMKDHPGGDDSIISLAGLDASVAFHDIHDHAGFEGKEMFRIGILTNERKEKVNSDQNKTKEEKNEKLLNPRRWVSAVLTEKNQESHDSFRFKFKLEAEDGTSKTCSLVGLPTGQHVLLAAPQDHGNGLLVRPYTPIHPVSPQLEGDSGCIEFLIKLYKWGKMSQYLSTLQLGDKLKVKGPSGPILYLRNETFLAYGSSLEARYINFVAGGTGITPVYQMARAILELSKKAEVRMIYANNTPGDILLRQDLEELAKKWPKRLKLWYTVATPGPEEKEWKYSIGRVNGHMFLKHLFEPTDSTVSFVCGPPAMIDAAVIPGLQRLGFTEDNLFEF